MTGSRAIGALVLPRYHALVLCRGQRFATSDAYSSFLGRLAVVIRATAVLPACGAPSFLQDQFPTCGDLQTVDRSRVLNANDPSTLKQFFRLQHPQLFGFRLRVRLLLRFGRTFWFGYLGHSNHILQCMGSVRRQQALTRKRHHETRNRSEMAGTDRSRKVPKLVRSYRRVERCSHGNSS
jgi:hypothetical protein